MMNRKAIGYSFAFFKFLFIFCLFTTSLSLQASESEPVVVELLHENTAVKPGHPFWVALHLKMDKTWHCYWKNPGDVGMPIAIEWNLPEGFEASSIEWPVPKRFDHDTIIGYGYEDEVILLSKITPSEEGITGESVKLGASLRWLACSDSACLPGSADVAVDLAIVDDQPQQHVAWGPVIAKARDLLPKEDHRNVMVQRNSDLVEIVLNAPAPLDKKSRAVFFPEAQNHIDPHAEASVTFDQEKPGLYVVSLKEYSDKLDSLKGILVLQDEASDQVLHAVKVDLPIHDSVGSMNFDSGEIALNTAEIQHRPADHSGFGEGLLFYMMAAFVGGLILNFMPCVLPVISLKVMSFVKMAGQDRSKTLKHGLSFSFGVLASFWFLAGLLMVLLFSGHELGWGFQMQNPIFISVLIIVMLIFSLSMFGVMELGTMFASWAGQGEVKARKSGDSLAGSFFSGVLATAVATPCTGPILGPALAFAVLQPPVWGMMVFTSLGFGMAFPYLLLSAFPSLLKFIPKPGNWMVTFKEFTGFMMMACVLWLLWVFFMQTSDVGATPLFALLLGLFVISLGCWIYGKWGSPIRKRRTRAIGLALGLLCLSLGGTISYSAATFETSSHWEDFSVERLHELQNKGVPVFVDFTASWCLICQSNHLVLSTGGVDEKLKDLGVVKMKADWTSHDPIITRELRKHDRNSVPLYLLYSGVPGSKPKVLPQVLTPSVVLEYLNEVEMEQIAQADEA